MSYRCCLQTRPSTTATSFADKAIDLAWRNFLSPQFETKFQRQVPHFWRYPNCLITVWDRWKEAFMPNTCFSCSVVSIQCRRCDGWTDRRINRQTDGQTQEDSKYHASIASRGKNVYVFSILIYLVRILIQNELLEQMDMFPYLGSLITEDGECTTEFRTRLNRGQAIEASLQKIWKSHSIPISTKIRLMKVLVWPVVTYGCESWTLRKNEKHVWTPLR